MHDNLDIDLFLHDPNPSLISLNKKQNALPDWFQSISTSSDGKLDIRISNLLGCCEDSGVT